jgi:hypothetical protein
MGKILFIIVFFCMANTAICQQRRFERKDSANKITKYAGILHQFRFFKLKDTLQITVTQFYRNTVFCYTEATPYALIIGTTNNKSYPKMISVLAICDNNVYHIGEELRVSQSYDSRIDGSPAPLNFAQDTIINGKRFEYIIGSEYPAVWANVNR